MMSRHSYNGRLCARLRNASGARRHSLCISDLAPVADTVASWRATVARGSSGPRVQECSCTLRRVRIWPKKSPPRPFAERFRRVQQVIGRNSSLRSSWKRDALEAYWPTIYWRATTVTTKNGTYPTDTVMAPHSKNRSNALILLRSFPASRAGGME